MKDLKERYLNKQEEFRLFFLDYVSSKEEDITTLKTFLDSIELNKNYFRTGLKYNHKNKTNKDSDTHTIKTLNNNLNKISNMNKDSIISEILEECKEKKHLYSYFFDTILQKTITHSNYIECYAHIIKGLIDDSTKEILLKSINIIKEKININHKIIESKENISYETFCDMNLYTEKIYGLNLLLVKIEKMGIIKNYVRKDLDDLFFILKNTRDDNTIFRVLSCLEQMSEEINDLLDESSRNILSNLKTSVKPKNKFKIMDILEKYN
tara:strand:- start:582 stop:1382 length:801 start_codon:yes stop_codon:yes gene_type:complete